MKMYIFTLMVCFLSAAQLSAQNLYTQSNAANIENEANTTTGWTGPAAITSSADNPQNGTWSLLITSNPNGNRHGSYTFTAVVGTVYNISIWARRGSNNSNSAFANWINLQNFVETSISSLTWTQYNFTVTATSTSPVIRVYASTGGPAGRSVYIDAITITAQTGGGGDTQPPTAPANLASSNVTETSLTLNWTASTDNVGVTNYRIYQNDTEVGQTGNNTTTFNVTGLSASTAYSYYVRAEDAAGNLSANSNTINVTTATGGGGADTEPPTAPTNLAATNVTTTTLTLSWTASTDNIGVTNYRIYQNTVQVGQTGNASTTFNVTGLTAATTYNYFVRALDAAGNISGNSNTANITTATDGGGGGGGNAYTTANANLPTVNWQAQNLYVAGVMGISSQPNSAFLLSVNGDIRTKDLIVQPGWSDFVFEPDYQLPTLKEVEEFIIANGRLIDIPSAAEIQENGARLGETNALLLLKIEELTLYLIEMNHRLDVIQHKVKVSY